MGETVLSTSTSTDIVTGYAQRIANALSAYLDFIASNSHLWEGLVYKYKNSMEQCINGEWNQMSVIDALKTIEEEYCNYNCVFSPMYSHANIVEQVKEQVGTMVATKLPTLSDVLGLSRMGLELCTTSEVEQISHHQIIVDAIEQAKMLWMAYRDAQSGK